MKRTSQSTAVRLLGHLRGQRVRLTVVAVSIVAYVALSIWNPMYSAVVIDHLWQQVQAAWQTGRPFSLTGPLGCELLRLTGQYLLSWVFYYLQAYLMASVAESLVLSLRTQVARKLNRLPLRFFDQNKAGEILSRVTSDLDKVSETLQTGLLKLIVALGTIVGSLIVMFRYSAPLTGVFLAFMAVCMLVTHVVAGKNLRCAAERQETVAVLTGIVEEYYNGRNVIKAYHHEAESIQRVSEAAAANRIANQRADFLTNCVNPLIRLLTRMSQVVIAIVAGRAMLNGTMSVGVVQAFFQYVNQSAEPMTEASYMINSLQSALASAERTFQLLDEEEERPDPLRPRTVEQTRGQVAFEHVRFGYNPAQPLMRDISFSVRPGQKIAVVGATGAGKTTLVNLLMRFFELNSGEIRIDGEDISRWSPRRMAQTAAYVSQLHVPPFPYLVKAKSGRVINIASQLGQKGGPELSAYSAAKGGVMQLCKAFSNDLLQYGINVNAIAPGYMDTEMNVALTDPKNPKFTQQRYDELTQRIPAHRWGTPDDMKGCCIFLASHASDYLGGAIIPVDGGYLVM